MKLFNKETECCGCGACVNICPQQAITMERNEEGFNYPKLNSSKCIDCGLCQKICPLKNEVIHTEENEYHGFRLKNNENRNKSSSGGVFQAIAQHILNQGGIVFAAGFNDKMHVEHLEIDNPENLIKVQKTKYVQSNLTDTYKRTRTHLKAGKQVLFVGTPCQIHSLLLFLGKKYENLTTISLICYGVPSPEIWEKYVDYLEDKHKGKLTFYNFRDKRKRDEGHTVVYIINDKEHSINIYKDPYCSIYFKKYMIRPSCHECHYSTTERISDFTIGDFWGCEKTNPKFNDKMGVSLVICHTQKGKDIYKEIAKDNLSFDCTKEQALQPRLEGPTPKHEKREKFMEHYKKWPFKLFLNFYSRF